MGSLLTGKRQSTTVGQSNINVKMLQFDIVIVKALHEVVLETLRPNSDIRLASVPVEEQIASNCIQKILVMCACIVSSVTHDDEFTC